MDANDSINNLAVECVNVT